MAWGVRTKDGRERVAGVLRALLITQLIISLVMLIFCYNASVKVMSLLKNIHKFTVFLFYALILLQAYCMKLHFTSGFRLLSWLLRCPHWPRAGPVTRLWLISGCLVAANGFLVHAACKSTLKVELGCCGVEHPSDWHQIPWINMDFLNEDSELVMNITSVDGKVLLPVSPYSCCSPYVLTPCYHDPLQQWSPREAPRASLQARACLAAVRAPLARVAQALYLFSVLVVLLQAVIVVLTQVVRSGALQAVARGDWTEHHHVPEQMGSNVSVEARALSLRRRARRLRTRSYPYLS
ncbi:unnamed protein product, partial [Brenthis ino]